MSIVAIAIAVVALALIATWVMRRRRQTVWRAFARRHGLRFHRGADGGDPCVAGVVDGRRVTLTISPASSDTGVLGVEEVVVDTTVRCSVPPGLEVVEQAGVERLLDVPAVSTGDEEFDRRACVTADDAEAARRFLTRDRRRALEDLFEAAGEDPAGLEGSRLFLRRRMTGESVRSLDSMLDQLLVCARRLEAHPNRAADAGA